MIAGAGWWIAIVMVWPAGIAPVRRRLADEQHPRPHVRLQRLRSHHRQRERQRHRRRTRRGWGRTGIGPPRSTAPTVARSPGSLPAVVDRSALGALWFLRRAPRVRRAAGRAPRVRQLARRDVARVQLHAGHLPRVLHGRPGRADGGRRRAPAPAVVWAPPPGGARRRCCWPRATVDDRAVVGDAAAPQRRAGTRGCPTAVTVVGIVAAVGVPGRGRGSGAGSPAVAAVGAVRRRARRPGVVSPSPPRRRRTPARS